MDQSLNWMRDAALGAAERMYNVAWQMEPRTFYAPLGETLVWITALADALGKIEEGDFSGLAYARNCVVHGLVVVTQVAVQEPMQRGPLRGDHHRIVGSRARVWGFTDDPEPHDPALGREKHAKRRADYNLHVAQAAVTPLLSQALYDLGVDDDHLDYKPTPR